MPIVRLIAYKTVLDNSSNGITGYEITKTLPYQHQGIYKVLGKAAENGLLTFRTEAQEHRPDRKVYTVNNKAALIEAMKDILHEPILVLTLGVYDIDAVMSCEKYVGPDMVIDWLGRLKRQLLRAQKETQFDTDTVSVIAKHLNGFIRKKALEAKNATPSSPVA